MASEILIGGKPPLKQRMAEIRTSQTDFTSADIPGAPVSPAPLYGERWPTRIEHKEYAAERRVTEIRIREGMGTLSAKESENIRVPTRDGGTVVVRTHESTLDEKVEVANDSKGRVRITIWDGETQESESRDFGPGELFYSVSMHGPGQNHILTAVGGDVLLRITSTVLIPKELRKS